MAIFSVRRWFNALLSSKPKDKAEIQARYAAFVKEHGELFEDKVVPLTTEELDDIARRKERFKRRWLIGLAMAVLFATVITFFFGKPTAEDGIYIVGLFFVVFGWRVITLGNLNRSLSNKEKRVLRGVVTNRFVDQGYFFEISQREKVQVREAAYKAYALGDILTFEILSKDVMINKKISKDGKI